MSDRRLTPANGRVAHISLRGQVAADRFVEGKPGQVTRPIADLRTTPGGPRCRQMLLGAAVTVLERRDDWAFVQAARDGYVGYLRSPDVAEGPAVTHHVASAATHVYGDEDIRSSNLLALPFGAQVTVIDERRHFFETPQGFVPKRHLWPLAKRFTDPVTVAQMHFGMPYLWGGNSIWGIDCSGLVQAGMAGCGIACPGDSDLQRAALGADLPPDTPLRRGDLVFWAGHVGLMVDPETLIHANTHHMAVAYEPLAAATLRIKAQGGGEIIARRRL